ncbi:MAG: polyprenyl synthetase family protein [Candidatus Altiarchaeota archaeon]|nr:polyprenyl synthetase family protein [Candidatus Altiarchaeota archaeon]
MEFDKFNPVTGEVNRLIKEVLTGKPDRLYKAARQLPDAGGKRIRPLLCILSCEAVGGERDDALRTAVAMELVHTFTLVHDDIMDNDELRRGNPSVHVNFGEPTAILAGDLLFAKAFEVCNPKIKEVLAKASSEICEGQELDMSFEERFDVSEEEYMEMIRKKTAVLFEAATKSGAMLGGASDREIEALALYGLNIGLAFQIWDDVLGVMAKEENLGKPVGSDIVEGKKSLVVIKTLEHLEQPERSELIRILKSEVNTGADIDKAMGFFRECHSIEYCKRKAEELIMDAKKFLKKLPDSQAREDLFGIADLVVEREV